MTPTPFHQAAAIGFFRSSVFFIFAIIAFMDTDRKIGVPAIMLVFLLDVTSWHITRVVTLTGNDVYNQTWFNVLADRFIFERLINKFRDRENVDFPSLIQSGTKDAKEDIDKFLADSTLWHSWGGFKRTLAGVGYFLWYWISYGIFYGAAAFLAGALKT